MNSASLQWAIKNPKRFLIKYAHPASWISLFKKVVTPVRGYRPVIKTAYEEFQDICVNQVSLLVDQAHRPHEQRPRKASVLIEGRDLIQNEFVIANTFARLGEGWDHIIYCTPHNKRSLERIIARLPVSVIWQQLPQSFSRNDYNNLLLSPSFWSSLDYDWVLIYQTDTYLFDRLDPVFFNYDYVGAPWPEDALPLISRAVESETLLHVGNGGLSLRNVSLMKKIVAMPEFDAIKKLPNSLDNSLQHLPEDIIFSYYISLMGNVAPVKTAEQFSLESKPIPKDAYLFGCHQPYLPSEGNRVFKSFKNRINGINVLGFANSVLGLGQNARNVISALSGAGRPYFANELVGSHRRIEYIKTTNNHWYEKNLVCCNPDYDYLSVVGQDYFNDKTNAALWAWELERVPPEWCAHAKRFSVIFTVSQFCKQVFQKELPDKEVVVLPLPGVRFKEGDPVSAKKHFGYSPDTRLFLFMFDGNSDVYRKNPDGVIRAFLDAFPRSGSERLVIKCHSISRVVLNRLQAVAKGDKRVVFMSRALKDSELELLMNACDIYVSLHRSEGFGLTMLEALAMGKPVVCTQWSGNTDFCKPEWVLPVDYKMIPVHKESDYYRRVQNVDAVCYWADPIHSHAVQQLQEVVRNYDVHKSRAAAGSLWVLDQYYDLSKTATLVNKYL